MVTPQCRLTHSTPASSATLPLMSRGEGTGLQDATLFRIGILPDNHLPQKQGVAQFETGY